MDEGHSTIEMTISDQFSSLVMTIVLYVLYTIYTIYTIHSVTIERQYNLPSKKNWH